MLDFCIALVALLLFWWLLLIVAILVRIKLGSPVIFKQPRPGKDERVFMLYKFRSMTDEVDADGNLLPDEVRLTSFGKKLRSTSLDELPELFNILKGDMALVGPRPQLVRDMVFMDSDQRARHLVRPGLTGLAQISGRNAIGWIEKMTFDLGYVQNVAFKSDCLIVMNTIRKVLLREGITDSDGVSSLDYGDWLLERGLIDGTYYSAKLLEAKSLIEQMQGEG